MGGQLLEIPNIHALEIEGGANQSVYIDKMRHSQLTGHEKEKKTCC